MRAGAFCDKRVIELMNRRFVNYYFNRSGMGEGGNEDAAAFTKGKTKNPYAYFAAFDADGKYLGETELYADKSQVFRWLRKLLEDNPQYDLATNAETEVAQQGGLRAALLQEELGKFDQVLALCSAVDRPEARLAEIRVARYRKEWDGLEGRLARLDAKTHGADIAVERGYPLLDEKQYEKAWRLLRGAAKEFPRSKRLGEMHFYAGVAAWFLDQRDWAKFHWMWVVENIPHDRMYMRCRIAAAAENMPYANAELDGFKSRGMIGPQHIVMEIARSKKIYERILPQWQRDDFSPPPEPEALKSGDLEQLVRTLVDDENGADNNKIVDKLVESGEASIAPLMKAIKDDEFAGRGWAAWALAKAMGASGKKPRKAMQLLRDCVADDDPYVRNLASSALSRLERGDLSR